MSEELFENESKINSDNEILSSYSPIMSAFDKIYNYITLLGLSTKKYILLIIGYIVIPFKKTIEFIKFLIEYFINFIKNFNKNVIDEAEYFFNDIKVAKLLIKENKSANKHQKENNLTLLKRFFEIATHKHKIFLKRAIGYILPSFAVIVLLIVVNIFSNLHFALDVTYNEMHIGYIENENVFRHAKEILEQRLEIGNEDYDTNSISQPEYKIAVVDLNDLSDANDICEQLIANSDSGLTTACGIYVDNKFIGSVKNESDASSVFKSYISAYCRSNNINQNNPKVILDLVEKVSYIQGLYTESTLMDSDDLREYLLTHQKSEISKYTVKNNDTPESICVNNNLTIEQFFALNPNLTKGEKIKKNTSVNVIRSVPFINVTVSKSETDTEKIQFKTIEIKTDSLYKGVKKIITPGVNGEKKVVNLLTYVDNVLVSTKEISSTVTKKPVDQKVYVGTKPIPNNVTIYGTQSGTFIWPTVGANTVSSGFGSRYIFGSISFHRGLDITGSGANGKPVIASASGTVEKVSRSNSGYGHCVLIDHGNGIKTRYAHCQAGSICVKVGQSVVQGQMIAKIGSTGNSTGPHLHFEIIYNGSYANPLKYLTR